MGTVDRERLAKEHLVLVERIVYAMRRRFGPAADVDEMRSFALYGLASAIDNYDEARGVAFSTYAGIRIRGAVYDGLVDASWFPRRLLRQIAFYRKADEALAAASDDPPPVDAVETAHRLADRLKELATAYVTSTAAPSEDERLSTHPEVEGEIDQRRYSFAVHACLGMLTTTQQSLLRRYYFDEQPLQEIAADLGYTKSWASRALRSALGDLRKSFGATRGQR
jgi:RNA polymerase sigma factor FliA